MPGFHLPLLPHSNNTTTATATGCPVLRVPHIWIPPPAVEALGMLAPQGEETRAGPVPLLPPLLESARRRQATARSRFRVGNASARIKQRAEEVVPVLPPVLVQAGRRRRTTRILFRVGLVVAHAEQRAVHVVQVLVVVRLLLLFLVLVVLAAVRHADEPLVHLVEVLGVVAVHVHVAVGVSGGGGA